MNRFRYRIAYHGKAFAGWQYQPSHRTVQGQILHALKAIGESEGNTYAAGRTDSGVHATGQIAHLDVTKKWLPERLQAAINANLPGDVRVSEMKRAEPGFHARYSAIGRYYVYRVTTSFHPLRCESEYFWEFPIDREVMEIATKLLLGTHDFSSFIVAGWNGNPVCTVHKAEWHGDDTRFRLHLYADHFGWKMVRRIVATLLAVGRKKFAPEFIAELLSGSNHTDWNEVVPAHGLIFAGVTFPDVDGGPEEPDPAWFTATDW
ncbi:MAG: tRNA pseudouridine(38-40) synthase TruA [bacterium]|nr:tRNA pseudouridine(38-40) synthase TruA [bacterium]